MVPYQGAGAAVGIDDAYIFASLLTHPSILSSTEFLTHIMTTYNRILVPHAHSLSNLSILQGHHYTLQSPEFDSFKEGDRRIPRRMLENEFKKAGKNWFWCESDPREERKTAMRILDSFLEKEVQVGVAAVRL